MKHKILKNNFRVNNYARTRTSLKVMSRSMYLEGERHRRTAAIPEGATKKKITWIYALGVSPTSKLKYSFTSDVKNIDLGYILINKKKSSPWTKNRKKCLKSMLILRFNSCIQYHKSLI